METKKPSRKPIREVIPLENGVQAKIDGELIILSKGGGELKRKLNYPLIIQENSIVLENKYPSKRDKRMIKSLVSHIKNMILGLNEKYVYKLQVCSVHFPMNASVRGEEFVIKNFLGEVKERKTAIFPGVEVKISGDEVTVQGSDKEKAGQTAMNIEKLATPRKRDRRIFQDGIWMTEKPGRRVEK